jgi:hypothetical protein
MLGRTSWTTVGSYKHNGRLDIEFCEASSHVISEMNSVASGVKKGIHEMAWFKNVLVVVSFSEASV